MVKIKTSLVKPIVSASMKTLSLREHQLVMLNIIDEFAAFCEEHNLRYFLDAGTLLGAVRHKGFIPWDNDADVCMPRADFDNFFELLKKNNFMLNDHLLLEIPENTIYTFYKLGDTRTKLIEFSDSVEPIKCLIYIDIFVKDGLPNNDCKAKRVCKKNERLSLWHWFYKYSIKKWKKEDNLLKVFIAKTADFLVRNKNKAFFKQNKYIKKIGIKYPYDNCEYVSTLSNGEYYRRCKRSNFDGYILMDFENRTFRVPAGYDDWLTVLYGDNYMEIPSAENQQVHNVVAEAEIYL